MSRQIILTVPPRMWRQFRETLLSARQNGTEEVIGFLFCRQQHLSRRKRRLLANSWVVPMSDCYASQGIGGLALRQEFHLELLRRYAGTGMDIVHVHTHPGRFTPSFSGIDDVAERQYSRFLARLPGRPRLTSCVFDENLHVGSFRHWRPEGVVAKDRVVFSAQWLEGHSRRNRGSSVPERFDRQRVFGRGFHESLQSLRVGLVGCGGIGACFAEQLSRLGVRRWVLVDPDRLETSNLNRLPAATEQMVRENWPKVRYIDRLIHLSWPKGAEIRSVCDSIQSKMAQDDLARCDLLITATDNHYSRMLCQELALRLMKPLLCLGTQIEVSETDNSCRILSRITVPPLGGGWCLMCGDIISANLAALEMAPSQITDSVRAAGYVPGVAAPAVYWANSCCASLGVYVVHGTLCGLLDLTDGIDWVMEYGQKRWLQVSHEDTDDCFYCSAAKDRAKVGGNRLSVSLTT